MIKGPAGHIKALGSIERQAGVLTLCYQKLYRDLAAGFGPHQTIRRPVRSDQASWDVRAARWSICWPAWRHRLLRARIAARSGFSVRRRRNLGPRSVEQAGGLVAPAKSDGRERHSPADAPSQPQCSEALLLGWRCHSYRSFFPTTRRSRGPSNCKRPAANGTIR